MTAPPEPVPPTGSVTCRRCEAPVPVGVPFCPKCGFAFGSIEGAAPAIGSGARSGPGAWILLPAVLGLAAVVTLVVLRLGAADPPPPVSTTDATTTTLAVADTGGSGFVEVGDESGRITVSVPASWSDVSGTTWEQSDEILGPAISAAADRAAWAAGWETPGLFLGADETRGLSPGEWLDAADFSADCVWISREPYDDGLYTGEIERYEDCGGTGSQFVQIAARPADGSFLGVLQIVLVGADAERVLDEIIATWTVEPAG